MGRLTGGRGKERKEQAWGWEEEVRRVQQTVITLTNSTTPPWYSVCWEFEEKLRLRDHRREGKIMFSHNSRWSGELCRYKINTVCLGQKLNCCFNLAAFTFSETELTTTLVKKKKKIKTWIYLKYHLVIHNRDNGFVNTAEYLHF